MNIKINIFIARALMLFIVTGIFIGLAIPAKADGLALSHEEREYLSKKVTLKAASIEGAAPHHYRNSKGEIKGISIKVLEEISNITGIKFEYHLYESINDVANSDVDVAFGLSKEYALPSTVLSKPYLESEMVLFYHKSTNPNQLKDKNYASIKGGTLPEGVTEDRVIYFNDREETIVAVEKGIADYGYGNAYSVAFYTLQNSCKNIITIPSGKGGRAYSFGVSEDDKVLLSILNKAIDAIDTNRMNALILDVSSQVERKVTFSMITDTYGYAIIGFIIITILVLVSSVFSTAKSRNAYKLENKRYVILSQLSNEYLFDYRIKTNQLHISDNLKELIDFEKGEEIIINLLIESIDDLDDEGDAENIHIIELPKTSGECSIFRMYCSLLWEEKGKVHSIIGKLVDISKETKEKQKLIVKSQMDGLTGLYNATATKEAIIAHINSKDTKAMDALILIDCDKFKEINDNHGHLKGDLALENIAKGLKLTFRQSDVIGRIGGDEFSVYMRCIPSAEFVYAKCEQLVENIKNLYDGFPIHISVGIAVLDRKMTYEELFKQADDALYIAKKNGGSQITIWNEKTDDM